ncbi:MAG: hypothetical protein ABSB60_06950 [Terracidiphilus sp.]
MATDQNPIDGLNLSPKILDVCVAWIGAAQGLPVGDDHGGALDDLARPTQFLRPANLNAAGIEGDPAGLNLFNGHAAVLRFLPEFVDKFDEVDEIRIQKGDSTASRIHDLPAAEIAAIPVEEVQAEL